MTYLTTKLTTFSRQNNNGMKRTGISLFNNTHVKNAGIESCFLIDIMYSGIIYVSEK
jgi:hypothetical protein